MKKDEEKCTHASLRWFEITPGVTVLHLPTNLTFHTRCGSSRLSGLNELILAHIWPNTDLVPSGPARPPLLRERFTFRVKKKKKKRDYGLICFCSVLNNFLLARRDVLTGMNFWIWQLGLKPELHGRERRGEQWSWTETVCGVKSKTQSRNSCRQITHKHTHTPRRKKSPYERHHM